MFTDSTRVAFVRRWVGGPLAKTRLTGAAACTKHARSRHLRAAWDNRAAAAGRLRGSRDVATALPRHAGAAAPAQDSKTVAGAQRRAGRRAEPRGLGRRPEQCTNGRGAAGRAPARPRSAWEGRRRALTPNMAPEPPLGGVFGEGNALATRGRSWPLPQVSS
ncbi:MAG: hypothetical protein J3K34DRAFT_426715 [Monoraphidium minutum]|nr:MAG: hypothetical protein J3K34DRAFT_426715 [Monoraphidium minutum]